MEVTGDYKKRDVVNESEVWENIAKTELTVENADHIIYARKRLELLNAEDYQHLY